MSNHTDQQGRYAFNQQPDIVLWNLSCLAQALLPLVAREALEAQLRGFSEQFGACYLERMRTRLGMQLAVEGDQLLIDDLNNLMAQQEVDITRFFRRLSDFDGSDACAKMLHNFFPNTAEFAEWLERYALRIDQEAASFPIRRMQMRAVNPKFILRNYMAEEVIRAADEGNFKPVNELLTLLRHPFDEHPSHQQLC